MPSKPPAAPPRHLRPLFRRFLLSVHPDLFSGAPLISKQNDESLQIVLPFFNSLFPSSHSTSHSFDELPSQSRTVVFHVKHTSAIQDSNTGDGRGTSVVRFTLGGQTPDAKASSLSAL
jgi:hypothetical protein